MGAQPVPVYPLSHGDAIGTKLIHATSVAPRRSCR